MSLVGNLEDLGLGDILQIVSLSRKSGILLLQSQNREGKIIFQNGQVIRATSSVFRENLGDLLIRRGIVDIETIKRALQVQLSVTPQPRIGTILIEQFGVERQTIDTIVREQIEKIVYSFFGWGEGAFSFELGDSSEELAATSFNPLQFMLDQGLNPQWLAMEGSRIIDEKRHRGESLEDESEEPIIDVAALLGTVPVDETLVATVDEPNGARNAGGRTVLLVDDDEVTRTALSKILSSKGFVVETAATAGEFLVILEDISQSGSQPLLLIDLILPRLDGSGVLGGLDLVERVRIEYPVLDVLVMSDHPNEEAERRILAMRLPTILAKPTKTEVRETRGMEQLERLVDRILQLAIREQDEGQDTPSQGFNLGAELRMEFGERLDPNRNTKGPESPGLHLLRGMLQELNNPSLGGGIILLVLRFASELMNRAVILLVKEDEIVGLGQFGIDAEGAEVPDVRVRRMKIPRNQGSVLDEVLQHCAPMKVKAGNSRWDAYLAEQLGGGQPEEIFLGPIVSERKVVALLYGDNLPERKPIGDTESLEIFLSQAGLAMEKALLERRLRGRETAA